MDPETFFPAPSEPADAAVALCRTCDVQGACLAWALDVGDCHGVWGGTTPRERRAMLVAWRSQAPWANPAVRDGAPDGELTAEVPADLSRSTVPVDLTVADLATAGPATAGPATAGPATAQPVTARPATAQPVTARPATARPAAAARSADVDGAMRESMMSNLLPLVPASSS